MQKQKHTRKSLLQAASVVSASTIISRITGLFRDIVSAQLFGVSKIWDAFVFAFMIPSLLRRLVGEGALSSAFIPIYTEVLNNQGKKEAERVANIVLALLTCALGFLLLGAHGILRFVLAQGWLNEKLTITSHLLLIIFPYIFFLAILAWAMGVLNCHKHFFIPSITPLILNVIWIVFILSICSHYGTHLFDKAVLLGWGIIAAGCVQLVVNYFTLRAVGYKPRLLFDFKHPALMRICSLMLPAALGFSITQLNIFIDLTLAMFIGDGANSALWYGNRVMQFPLGVFGFAMGTAMFPTLSYHASQNNMTQMKETIIFSLRSIFLIIIPSSIGLMVLREPIIRLLFERGAFDALATERTTWTLLYYCVGLFSYAAVKILISAFYSLQDTKTPVKIGVICMLLNIVFNIILMQFLREGGLALATAICSIINLLFLAILLQKKIGVCDFVAVQKTFLHVLAVSVGMGFGVHYIYAYCARFFNVTYSVQLLLCVLCSIGGGIVLYGVLGLVTGISEIKKIYRSVLLWKKTTL